MNDELISCNLIIGIINWIIAWFTDNIYILYSRQNILCVIIPTIYYSCPCTLYNIYCTMYTVQWTMYNVRRTLCTVQCINCTLYSVQCIICTVHNVQRQSTRYCINYIIYMYNVFICSVHCTVYSVQCIKTYTLHIDTISTYRIVKTSYIFNIIFFDTL